MLRTRLLPRAFLRVPCEPGEDEREGGGCGGKDPEETKELG